MTMKRLAVAAVFGALATIGCSDATSPGNASQADRTEILSVLEESGWFDEDFGVEGAVEDASLSAVGFDLGRSFSMAGAMDTVPLTQRWGRRFHAPTARSREVNVSGDTATVVWSVTFGDGEFLLDRTRDGVANPTGKPMDVTTILTATLVKRAEADSAGRRWRLVALSPARTVNTAEDQRTVDITQVTVAVNGTVVKTITDASRRESVDQGLLDLAIGDEVTVRASVTNTTGHDNVPQTFVFLHLFHAREATRAWVRVPMRRSDDGTWFLTWQVRQDGRQRLIVDAIDSQTFNSDTEDDYRSEIWGVPYRIGR